MRNSAAILGGIIAVDRHIIDEKTAKKAARLAVLWSALRLKAVRVGDRTKT